MTSQCLPPSDRPTRRRYNLWRVSHYGDSVLAEIDHWVVIHRSDLENIAYRNKCSYIKCRNYGIVWCWQHVYYFFVWSMFYSTYIKTRVFRNKTNIHMQPCLFARPPFITHLSLCFVRETDLDIFYLFVTMNTLHDTATCKNVHGSETNLKLIEVCFN